MITEPADNFGFIGEKMEAQRAILFLETVLYTGRMCSSISHCDYTMYIRPVSLMLGASCMLDTTLPTELHPSYFLSALLDLCLRVTQFPPTFCVLFGSTQSGADMSPCFCWEIEKQLYHFLYLFVSSVQTGSMCQ